MYMYNVETVLWERESGIDFPRSSCARDAAFCSASASTRLSSAQLANRFSVCPLPAYVSRPHSHRPWHRPSCSPCRDRACAPHWIKWNKRSALAATWRHTPAPAVYPIWDPTLLLLLFVIVLGIPNRVVLRQRERERDLYLTVWKRNVRERTVRGGSCAERGECVELNIARVAYAN